MPSGSYRERLALAACGVLASIRRAGARLWQSPPPEPPAAVESTPLQAAGDDQDVVMRASSQPWLEWGRDARVNLSAVPYFPGTWQVEPASPGESRFLNLIILSLLHRSGSTLLQRICNARKKTLIWGEHCAILQRFADIYQKVAGFSITESAEREEYFARGEDPNLWTANMCPDVDHVKTAVVNSARSLLNSLYRQHRDAHDIVGFKEVQYGRAEAELLQQCYPEAKIVFLVRHPLKMWSSTPRHWYPSFDAWLTAWSTRARDFIMLARARPNCYLIRYEDIVQKAPTTMELVKEVAQVTDRQISDVLGHKIGSRRVGVSDAERETILQRCREPMELLGYA